MSWALCAALVWSAAQGDAPPKAPVAGGKIEAAPPKAEAPAGKLDGAAKTTKANGKVAEPEPKPPSLFDSFLPVGIMLAAAYLLLFRPNQKTEQKRREQLSAVKKDDKVVTAAGIVGVVANVEGDFVTLKVDESQNVRMKFRKTAIVEILKNA